MQIQTTNSSSNACHPGTRKIEKGSWSKCTKGIGWKQHKCSVLSRNQSSTKPMADQGALQTEETRGRGHHPRGGGRNQRGKEGNGDPQERTRKGRRGWLERGTPKDIRLKRTESILDGRLSHRKRQEGKTPNKKFWTDEK